MSVVPSTKELLFNIKTPYDESPLIHELAEDEDHQIIDEEI